MCHSQKYETKLSWAKPQTQLPGDAPSLYQICKTRPHVTTGSDECAFSES